MKRYINRFQGGPYLLTFPYMYSSQGGGQILVTEFPGDSRAIPGLFYEIPGLFINVLILMEISILYRYFAEKSVFL